MAPRMRMRVSARARSFPLGLGSDGWILTIATIVYIFAYISGQCEAKVFGRCELAQKLHTRFGMSYEEVGNWVCIAEHTSSLNSAAYATGLTGGSHGIFQISDTFWCSPPGKGFACNVPCEYLRDDDLADDIACARIIFDEHQRISGNGYTAWNAYEQYCHHGAYSYIAGCFQNEHRQLSSTPNPYWTNKQRAVYSNSINAYLPLERDERRKIYNQCELAQELYYKHKMPMEQIPTWVCIAEHESRFDTAAIGRLNTDGSADHGLFQISDLYWCSNDRFGGGKACGLSCGKLLDQDITDDVRCVRRIHDEHTRISGDGFMAWTVYDPFCRNQEYEHISHCFEEQTELPPSYAVEHTHSSHTHEHTTPAYLNLNKYLHQHQHQHQYSPYQANPFLKPHYTTASYHSTVHAPPATPPTNTNTKTNTYTYNHVSYTPHKGKVYNRCELAQELFFKHKFPMQDIATWVCIAEHESSFETSAVGRFNADGSADHGLFQISDLYWCTHNSFGGKGCGLPCHKLLDSDLTDDIKCIRTIYDEHTRITGDGFTAWTVYDRDCREQSYDIADCFDKLTQHINHSHSDSHNHSHSHSHSHTYTHSHNNRSSISSNNGISIGSVVPKGKIYKECELALELLMEHKMPMDEIATWVCIAYHESSFNTAAVGRLNTDGSADHGLFQISDLYWCSHDEHGGKACNMPCHKLLDADITDDIQCIKTIHDEHTRISGDGFNAWTVYKPYCHNRKWTHISKCFENNFHFNKTKVATTPTATATTKRTGMKHTPGKEKGKVYKKCELAQELYFDHKMPMWQIPTWVCIAQHESNFDTSAIGRLNADGSADHGLFQISDLYWCFHDGEGGAKACNMPCDKLIDSDINDDVRCIRIIYDEHTLISGDGFTAWTVYNRNCRNQKMQRVSDCFDQDLIEEAQREIPKMMKPTPRPSIGVNYNRIDDYDIKYPKPKYAVNHPFVGNPFLNRFNATSEIKQISMRSTTERALAYTQSTPAFEGIAPHPNYISNPFLQKFLKKGETLDKKEVPFQQSSPSVGSDKSNQLISETIPQKKDYTSNPFLGKFGKTRLNGVQNDLTKAEKHPEVLKAQALIIPHATNPFLNRPSEIGKDTNTQNQQTNYGSNPFLKRAQSEVSLRSEETEKYLENPFLSRPAPQSNTATSAEPIMISTERSFRYNPFLMNTASETTHSIDTPRQEHKTNNYLNSNTFRRTTTTTPTTTPPAPAPVPFQEQDTTLTPTTSIDETIETTALPNTQRYFDTYTTTPTPTTQLNPSTTSTSTSTPYKYTTKSLSTTHRTTYRPFILDTPPNRNSFTTKPTKSNRLYSTTRTPSPTPSPTSERPIFSPTTIRTILTRDSTTPTTRRTTTATIKPTTYRPFERYMIPKTTTVRPTSSTRNIWHTPFWYSATTPTPTPTASPTKFYSTIKNPLKTQKPQHGVWTTTRKPKPAKWSYNWADFFYTTAKTTTTAAATTITTTRPLTTRYKTTGNNSSIYADASFTTKSPLRKTTTTTRNYFSFFGTTTKSKKPITTTKTTKTTTTTTTVKPPKITTTKPKSLSYHTTTRRPNRFQISYQPTTTKRTTTTTTTRKPATIKTYTTTNRPRTTKPTTHITTIKSKVTSRQHSTISQTKPTTKNMKRTTTTTVRRTTTSRPKTIRTTRSTTRTTPRRTKTTARTTTRTTTRNPYPSAGFEDTTFDYITASEYSEKYRMDPFSHPFFAKYNKRFEYILNPRNTTTPRTRTTTSIHP